MRWAVVRPLRRAQGAKIGQQEVGPKTFLAVTEFLFEAPSPSSVP